MFTDIEKRIDIHTYCIIEYYTTPYNPITVESRGGDAMRILAFDARPRFWLGPKV
jgi:hypothetical protein